MRTRLVSPIAAMAAVFSAWWLTAHDENRSLGEVSVLVVANPPSGSVGDPVTGLPGSAAQDACSGLSAALTPDEVEWSSATQPNGTRACRWLKSWRSADLVRQTSPGEPKVDVQDDTISVRIDPLSPEQQAGISTLEVTVSFPGEVASFSGAGAVAGSTVEWTNPDGFFDGTGLSASGRDRPMLISLLPWLAGGFALIALVGAIPWTRAVRTRVAAAGESGSDPNDVRSVAPDTSVSLTARHDERPTIPASPSKGDDPHSPWRPPSPQ